MPIANDDVDEENETFTVTLSEAQHATLADGEATGTIEDDDERGLTAPPTLNVPENGSATYEVLLSSQPTDEVTMAVTVPTGTDVSVNKPSLTFTASNWNTAQTITVTAADDADALADEAVTISHSATGGDYTG